MEKSKVKLKFDFENLFCDIRILEPDNELRTEDEISEKSLKDGIKKNFSKIQEY